MWCYSRSAGNAASQLALFMGVQNWGSFAAPLPTGFDASGRCLRLTGLTAGITDRKRAEEQQRMLVRELDHRVKNLLASIARVAQRTREGSRSMDEYLPALHSRIQPMSNAHAFAWSKARRAGGR